VAIYDNAVKWFGSAEKYAQAIKDREKSGGSFSDPAAAEAFKKANPQYFKPVDYQNELEYAQNKIKEAESTGNLGLKAWASQKANEYARKLAEQQARGVGVTGPVDRNYTAALASGTPYEVNIGSSGSPVFSKNRSPKNGSSGMSAEDQAAMVLKELLARSPSRPTTLSFEDASSRAAAALNPLYNQQLQGTLKAVERDLIRRGFFGQMPSVPITREEAANVENARAAAIGSLANQMVGQSEQQALQAQQLAQNHWATQAQLALNALQNAQQQRQNKFSNALNLLTALAQIQSQKSRDELAWAQYNRPYEQLTQAEKAQIDMAKAGLTGTYQGQPTLEARQLDAQQQAQAFQNALAERRLAQQAAENKLRNLFNIWENTGQAPAGIPSVEAGTKLFTPPAEPSKDEIKADAIRAVDEAIQEGLSREEIEKNILAQYADLVSQGVDPQFLINYLDQKEVEGAFNK